MLQVSERCPPLARQADDEWIVTQPFSPERHDNRVSFSPKSPLLKPSDFNLRIQHQHVISIPSTSPAANTTPQVVSVSLLPPSAFAVPPVDTEASPVRHHVSPHSRRSEYSEPADDTLADIQR